MMLPDLGPQTDDGWVVFALNLTSGTLLRITGSRWSSFPLAAVDEIVPRHCPVPGQSQSRTLYLQQPPVLQVRDDGKGRHMEAYSLFGIHHFEFQKPTCLLARNWPKEFNLKFHEITL